MMQLHTVACTSSLGHVLVAKDDATTYSVVIAHWSMYLLPRMMQLHTV